MSEAASDTDHSAAASVLGYLHQTRWGVLELLRARTTHPGRSLTLEMHDDIAWEQGGTPAELKQLKLHVSALRNLTAADLIRGILANNDHPAVTARDYAAQTEGQQLPDRVRRLLD